MAEAILRKKLKDQGAQLVSVQSAGTAAAPGLPASFIGVSVLRSHGIELINHRSQPVTKKLMDKFDLALAMATDHYDFLIEKFPKNQHKVHLFMNYGREDQVEDPNVVDPITGDWELYEEVYQLLDKEMERITAKVINESMNKY